MPDAPRVIYDSFQSAPDLAPLRAAVAANSWSEFETALSAFSVDAAFSALTLMGDEDVDQFLQAAPPTAIAQTTIAARKVVLAWRARGPGNFDELAPERYERFQQHLNDAEQMLIAACAQEPSLALAWAMRVYTARGLNLSASEAWRRYRHHEALAPHSFAVQAHMLLYLLPRWFGSWDDAITFARESAAAAPEGCNSGALIAYVHLERWMELRGGKAGRSYLAAPEVLDELRAAAARSVLNKGSVLDVASVEAHSAFAMAFWVAGKRDDAERHLVKLNGRASTDPWMYATDLPPGMEPVPPFDEGHSQ